MKTWSRLRLSLVRDKLQVFFLGLLLGLVLGGGFFLLKLDEYVQKMEFYKSLTSKDDDAPAEKNKPKPGNREKSSRKNERNPSTGNTAANINETDSTAVSDGSESGGPAGDEDIDLRTNEIIGQAVVPLRNFDQSSGTDSVMRKEAGVHEEASRNITVEYWRSPLNTKYYTLTRSRLVLFGFTPEDKIQLSKIDNQIYMKTPIGVFRLEYTSKDKPYERVSDESVLSRING
ncbi:MAG: hypothetical protein IM638_09715 [Bacteroidetes bacterium]|nr:hypothetical protein [Bacteroidota bacterium]